MKHYNKNTKEFIYNNYIENENGIFFLDTLSRDQKYEIGILEVQEPEYNPEYQTLEYKIKNKIYTGTIKDIIPKEQYLKEKLEQDFTTRAQEILDSKAKEHGYDNIVSACSYSGYENDFQAESIKFGIWRSKVWKFGYGLLEQYKDKKPEEIPSLEELIEKLPKFE